VKTRIDLDFPIEDLALAIFIHEGDWWPGPDRIHYVWAVEALDVPPYIDGFVWAAPLAEDHVIIRPALDFARVTAHLLVSMPNVTQDICPICRGLNPGPNRPRWNIYHNGPYKILTPCILKKWW
jgi:hypothetical protein